MNRNEWLAVLFVITLGGWGPSCKPKGAAADGPDAQSNGSTPGVATVPKEVKPKLPPDSAPPLSAKAAEVASIEKDLLADPKYATIWNPKARGDMEQVLSVVAMAMATMTNANGGALIPDAPAKTLTAKKLDRIAEGVVLILARTGSPPDDFRKRVEEHLESVKDEPHHGVWRTGAKDAMDWSALASWLRREDPSYLREVIDARKQGPFKGWDPVKEPFLPYLARERAALERLALLTGLTQDEQARLAELKASRLGDTPPEEIKLSEMLSEYSSNEVRADDAYKGHVVEFAGVAGALERGTIGGITLTIGTGKAFERPQVHCFFEKSQTDKVKALNKGDRIRVRGKVDGLMANVVVRYCELVE